MIIRISKNWLKDFVDFDFSDTELSELLSLSGTLVEGFSNPLEGVVVAKILSIKKHSNAEKLQIVEASDGKEKYRIVCGAANIEVGQLVPLAKIGAMLSGGEIKEVEIRGEKSSGMLCSQSELGLGDDKSGIMILSSDYKIGEEISKYFNTDSIFDLEITPNRGDCLSHLGVAREIAGLLSKTVRKLPIELKKSGEVSDEISVSVSSPELCPKYFARVVHNVKVEESPKWLKERLASCGITAINNIVDITNYIMLDLGQPMHAFDAEKIGSKRILVREGLENEEMVSLDGTNILLDSKTLVITDGEKPLAIAGVIGGADSGISVETNNVVLEAANFSAKSIRRTMKKFGLTTDSGQRFERGVDSQVAEYAINKAAKMVSEIAGGKVISGIEKFSSEIPVTTIKLEAEKVNKLLGTDLTEEAMTKILKRLGFSIVGDQVKVPSWRPDVQIWPDLAEEVARIYGFENIPRREIEAENSAKNDRYLVLEYTKDLLCDLGFNELINYSFVSDRDLSISGINKNNLLEVANPIAPQNKFLRNSLLPGLFKNVSKNSEFDPVLLFEIGNVFDKKSENIQLSIVAAGKKYDNFILSAADILSKNFKISQPEISKLTSEELKSYKIKKQNVSYFSLPLLEIEKKLKSNVEKIMFKKYSDEISYHEISKYPSISRDLAFIVQKDISPKMIIDEIYQISNKIILVHLFDEFSSEKIGVGKKNLAFHIFLQDNERTLTDSEGEKIISEIIKKIENKFKAKIRM
ncbi:MAG: phenylalanine--tRNA ligase subunit beta [Candidatus Berkelbacteria bacterium]|nr:phenylalanine--tRNA ligase subunit beta [Candidatus Berkelbacteria bacterium]